ncbi:hypothetical protein ACFLWO_02560, partial [Chloroflexota bacterium]
QQLKLEEERRLAELKVAEREQKLEKSRQQSSEIKIQRTEVDFHMKSEIITGTLNINAGSGGQTVPEEKKEEFEEWKRNLPGSVGVILGKRGSGKSSTGGTIGEYMRAEYGMDFYWFGIPKSARELLPSWVLIPESLEQIPNNSFVHVDETGLAFLSLKFADKLFSRR